jgi:hypothetical protein
VDQAVGEEADAHGVVEGVAVPDPVADRVG